VDDAHATEARQLIAVIEMLIDAGGAGVVAEEVRLADAREERVLEGVRQGIMAGHVWGFRQVDARPRFEELLDLGETAHVIDVVVGDENALDIGGVAAELTECLEDSGPGARAASVDEGDLVVHDEIGARATCAHLVEAREHLAGGAEWVGLDFVPALSQIRALLPRASRADLIPAVTEGLARFAFAGPG
jgi:hypothetical protein